MVDFPNLPYLHCRWFFKLLEKVCFLFKWRSGYFGIGILRLLTFWRVLPEVMICSRKCRVRRLARGFLDGAAKISFRSWSQAFEQFWRKSHYFRCRRTSTGIAQRLCTFPNFQAKDLAYPQLHQSKSFQLQVLPANIFNLPSTSPQTILWKALRRSSTCLHRLFGLTLYFGEHHLISG